MADLPEASRTGLFQVSVGEVEVAMRSFPAESSGSRMDYAPTPTRLNKHQRVDRHIAPGHDGFDERDDSERMPA